MLRGYKAYESGLVCRDHQYEVDKTYELDKAVICHKGFHFCENPLDVLNYYDLCSSEFTEVEALGDVSSEKGQNDSKRVTNKIKIGARMDLPAFIKASFEFLWEKCTEKDTEDYSKLASSGHSSKLASSGHYSQLASSGHSSQLASSGHYSQLASSGHYSKLASSGDSSKLASSGHSSQLASSGHYSQLASSGHYSKLASSGDSSKLASSGDYSKLALNGLDSVGACVGIDSKIKGKIGCWITLAEWKWNGERRVPVSVRSAQIDGDVIKEDTWYKLENGEFVEA